MLFEFCRAFVYDASEHFMNKKILLVVVALVIVAGAGLLLTRGGGEIKISDKSATGVPADWLESVGDGLSFKYPEALGANYIGTMIWPPQAYILGAGPLLCTEGGVETGKDGKITKKEIEKTTYCVTQKNGGATGSTLTQYAYAFEKDKQIIALIFALRFSQCSSYSSVAEAPAAGATSSSPTISKKAECEAERARFNIDATIDRIAQTIKLSNIQDAPDTTVVPKGA